jgi:hypothetical protein
MLEASVAYVLMSYNYGVRPVQNKSKPQPRQPKPQPQPKKPQSKSPDAVELYFMRK